MLWPTRVFRYLVAELLGPTILGLLLWTFVLLMNHFFLVAEKTLSKNLGFDLTLQLFLVGLPAILVLALPMSVLLGSLVAMGRVSADNEWVALQSAGQSPWRILRPLLFHGVVASLVGLVLYGELAPRANYAQRDLQGDILFSSSLAADLRPRVFYTELENSVLFVHDIGSGSSGRLEGVLLIRHDPRKGSYDIILAQSGDLYPSQGRDGTLFLDLYRGVSHRFTPEKPESYLITRFEETREPFPPAAYLKGLLDPPDKVVQDMGLAELFAEVRTARSEQTAARRLRGEAGTGPAAQEFFLVDHRVRVSTVELHSRLALPLASLVMAFVSLPLGIRRARSGKGAGFAVSLLVILLYWATYTFARDQALAGKLPPALGPWLANLVVACWGIFGLIRLRYPADPGSGPMSRVWNATGFLVQRLRHPFRARELRLPPSATSDVGTDALVSLGGTPNRFLFRVDQYVALCYLRHVALAVGAAYLIYGLVEVKKLTDGLLRTRQPPRLILEYLLYFVPSVLHIVVPVACLVGAVVGITLLARNGELTALQAGGRSLQRATVPILVVTAMMCGVLFVVQDSVAPVTNRKARETEDQILGRAPRTYGIPPGGRWGFGPEGRRLYHYRVYDTNQQEFQAFTVLTLDRSVPEIVDHLYARRARWLGGAQWEISDGWERSLSDEAGTRSFRTFSGVERATLEAPAELGSRQLAIRTDVTEQLSLRELRNEITDLDRSGYDTTRLRVARQGKIARVSAPFVMVLLGLPFAFRVGRRGALYGIGVALLLVIVYWACFAVFNALGLETIVEPWAAAWTPNVFFGLLGACLLLYVRS